MSSSKKAYNLISENSPLLRTFPSKSVLSSQISIYATLIVVAASLGGFSYGYTTAIISGVLVSIGSDLDGEILTSTQQQSVASVTAIAAIFGCITSGLIADKIGRKNIISLSCILFVISSVEMALCSSYKMFLSGRFLLGFPVGAVSMVVPIYVSEVAPSRLRGSLMTLNSLGTTLGQFLAYVFSALLENHKYSWRLMIILGSIVPLLFLLASPFICESPRLLVIKSNPTDAAKCFRLIFPMAQEYQIDDKITLIQKDLNINPSIGNTDYQLNRISTEDLKSTTKNSIFTKSTIRALVIGCGLMCAQQLSGIAAFLNYSATIFKSAGINNAMFVSIFVSLANFLFTCANVVLIDITGRRKLLLYSMGIMIAALIATGFVSQMGPAAGALLVTFIVIYISAYAVGLGVIPWCSVEFLPQESRSLGAMIMSCINWSMNFLVSMTFLDLNGFFKLSGTAFIYALLSLAFYIFIIKFYPEVTGLPLEDIRKIFENGYDISYADELRKELGIGCDNDDVETTCLSNNSGLRANYSNI
ncbi:hypothetical protein PACTADRAFT_75333 [Pachysolen tannophilus NRRL Y-2460]|uniref:Major facilitator superfamily (MFS) profile domain-containing protein n=1 Tax=Pachysolen tannophilus NRRL Y-2460 TaxID=669874 RepID=A0A1E4TWM8_PACTA|nr:hypothetical protein PACTADRAFT_75333 [Pachysolen tannophilus NRRL Y-2460]